ncbi:MAG: hypothetical protein ACETWM_18970 [Candidatus Lokiarchaeia archaeon]
MTLFQLTSGMLVNARTTLGERVADHLTGRFHLSMRQFSICYICLKVVTALW